MLLIFSDRIFPLLLIVPIEFLAQFSRIISLSVRLFANMMAGHTLLHIIATFSIFL